MNRYYSYIWSDPLTNIPFYVGKGSGFRYRDTQHNKTVNGYVKKLKKNGLKPLVDIVYATNEVAAFWLERCFIAAFGRVDVKTGCLFNHTNGGEGLSGRIVATETRHKMSLASKGKPKSIQHRLAMSKSQRLVPRGLPIAAINTNKINGSKNQYKR